MEKNVVIALTEKCRDGEKDPDTIDLTPLTVDKTASNAIRSPLLRLPAEIRQQIWSLYCRNVVINVDGPNRMSHPLYDICVWDETLQSHVWKTPPHPPQPPHHLTFNTCGPITDQICEHITPSGHDRPHSWQTCRYALRVFHPLVCKQFWYETHGMFIGRATWVFFNHLDLVLFIKTKRHVLQHVRKLIIYGNGWCYRSSLWVWIHSWQQALTWSKMRHFTLLQGVELHMNIPYDEKTFSALIDPRHDPLKNNWKLQAVLRSLQQHKLQADLTSVKFYPLKWGRFPTHMNEEQLATWEAAWRDKLLTHVPLGQGPRVTEKKWARSHLKGDNKMEGAQQQ